MAPSIRASDLSATARHLLKQPLAVSAIASLGVHVVLFATMPFWSNAAFSDTEPDIPRSVDLIELTPEEQSRLPEMSTPITLPPLFQDSFPDMTLLPVPDQSTPPPPAGFFAEPLFPSFPSFGGTVPTPRTNPVPAVPPQPPSPPPAQTEAQTQTQPDNQTDTIESNGGLPTFTGHRRGQILEELELDEEFAANPDSTPQTESPITEPPARSNEEIIARLQQDIRDRQERIRTQQLLSYNVQGTSQDPNYSAAGSWLGWMESLSENFGVDLSSVNPESNQFETSSIEATFPPEACGHINQTLTADYGVVIDAEGVPIAESLAVLRNSGYGLLDERGGLAVLDSTFENDTNANMPYQVTVEFPYTGESCANQETVSQAEQ